MHALANQSTLDQIRATYDLAAANYDGWAWQRIWREREYPLVREMIERSFSRPCVLDLGCGTGGFAEYCQDIVGDFTGVDLSEQMVGAARGRHLDKSRFYQASLAHESFPRGMFDVLVCLRVLNHLPEIETLLMIARKALRTGGLMVLTDVAHEHRYAKTSVPTPSGKRSLATYKHHRDSILQRLNRANGYECLDTISLRASGENRFAENECLSIDRSGQRPFGRLFVAGAI